ncbi:MAG: 3-coathanger stack domain-containing protein [Bacteroidota bacterium]
MRTNLLITIVFSLAYFSNTYAQSFYVSNTGNDSNPGTFNSPWKTFQKACNAATPGSTVYLRDGTYKKAWLNVTGSSGNFITFKSYNSEQVYIDGGSTNTQTELLVINNKSYIRISNLHFRNAMGNYSSGIYIANGSHHIEILDNKISHINFSTDPNAAVSSFTNSYPFIVYNQNPTNACHHILVKGNEIADCRTGFSEALTLNGNVDGFEVSNNKVHDITNIGIDLAGGYGTSPNPLNDMARNGIVKENEVYNCVSAYAVSAGIYVDGGQDIIVERNICHHNGRGFEVGCEELNHETKNIIVRDNISYLNKEAGIGIGGYNYPSTGKVTNSQILNNTFYHNNTSNIFDGELLIEYTENCTVKNNIFYATNTEDLLIVTRLNSTGIVLDYNLYYHSCGTANSYVDWEGNVWSYADYLTNTGQDANSLFDNPNFTDVGANDFTLNINSPAVNSGDPNFSVGVNETDFGGNDRLVGQVDIGAYEFVGSCNLSLNLTGNINQVAFYYVQTYIHSENIIEPVADVVFSAGDEIILEVGFWAKGGSSFQALISDCTVIP